MIVTVTYNANGGTGTIPTGYATKGQTYTVQFDILPTKSGKVFDGWATSASGAVVYTSTGTKTFTANNDTYTLYAHWVNA